MTDDEGNGCARILLTLAIFWALVIVGGWLLFRAVFG